MKNRSILRGFTFRTDGGFAWEPVGFCDSRFLRTMMLKAWDPKADFEMLKQIGREKHRDEQDTERLSKALDELNRIRDRMPPPERVYQVDDFHEAVAIAAGEVVPE